MKSDNGRRRDRVNRMHPLFVELYLAQESEEEHWDERRRARRRKVIPAKRITSGS